MLYLRLKRISLWLYAISVMRLDFKMVLFIHSPTGFWIFQRLIIISYECDDISPISHISKYHRLQNVTTTEAQPRLWWHLGVCGVMKSTMRMEFESKISWHSRDVLPAESVKITSIEAEGTWVPGKNWDVKRRQIKHIYKQPNRRTNRD